MLEGIKDKFSRFVKRNIVDDEPPSFIDEDLFAPEVIEMARVTGLKPELVFAHEAHCAANNIGFSNRAECARHLNEFARKPG